MENQSVAEERAAAERRRQQAEENRAARVKPTENATTEEDTTMLDTLLEKLRAGDSVKGRSRKRPTAKERLAARPAPSSLMPLMPSPLTVLSENGDSDAGDLARGMLAALKSDGFGPGATPDASILSVPMSPTKRRARIKSDPLLVEEIRNLTGDAEMLMDDAEVVEMPDSPSRDPSEA